MPHSRRDNFLARLPALCNRILGVTPFAVVIADLTEDLDLDVCFDLLRQAYLTGRMHGSQKLRLACLLNRLAGFEGSTALLSQAISFVVTMMHRQEAVDEMNVINTTKQLFDTPVIKRLTLTEDGEIQKRKRLACYFRDSDLIY